MSRCGPAVSCCPQQLLFPNQMISQCLGVGLLPAVTHVGSIFPNQIISRCLGVGLLSAVARVGSILSPFIVMAGETLPGTE
jgi:hypothetical protein